MLALCYCRRFMHVPFVIKVMISAFWHKKGVLIVEYCPRRENINAARYCDTSQLQRAIQYKRIGMLSRGIYLLHDNVWHYVAGCTQKVN